MSDSTTINALIGAQRSASVLDRIANPPQINPLAGIQAGAEAARTVQGVRGLAAHQAWGDALARNTDPQTGAVNYGGAVADLARSGNGGLAMPEATEASSARITEQLNRGHLMVGWLQGAGGALPDNASRDQIESMFKRGVAAGILTPDMAAKSLAEVPTDPAKIPAYIQQLRLSGASVMDQFKAHYGEPIMVGQGSQVQPLMRSPQTGAVTPTGAPVPLYASPETQGSMVTWINKDTGAQEHSTWADFNIALGNGRVVGGSVAPAGPRPGTAAVPGTTTAPPAPGKPPPSISGPEAGMPEKWKASAEQYNAANEAAGNYQARIFPLVQAYGLIKSGTVTTGQSADAWNQIRGTLQTAATKMGWDAQSIAQANSEQLVKYTQQYINAQGLSARSDQALASAISGNPGSHISTLANEQVMPAMIGMERMRQMMLADFKAQPGDKSSPRNFSDFQTTWQNTHDPRAFLFDMLSKEERTRMAAGMKTPLERKRFADTLDIVERNPGIMGQAVMPH